MGHSLASGEAEEPLPEEMHSMLTCKDRESKGREVGLCTELCGTPTVTKGRAEVTEPQTLALPQLCQALDRACLGTQQDREGGSGEWSG